VASAAATHPINYEIVQDIKERTTSWEPHMPHENPLKDMTEQELTGLAGTIIAPPRDMEATREIVSTPQDFDSRTKWGACIHPVRNQMQCGSCWAFGATEALSDRFCINGEDVILSPQYLVSCDHTDMGCGGGWLPHAWAFMTNPGVVADSADPYTSGGGVSGTCSAVSAKKYQCQEGSVAHLGTPSAIKSEIFTNGPVETAFTVYADFYNYHSGIYHHVTGGVVGGHAVKIIGYGVTAGQDYWLIANSWGASWGMQGFFKIRQGDCGINDAVYFCNP